MKPLLIVAAAIAIMVGFVVLIQVPGKREDAAIAQRQQDSLDRDMAEYRCNLSIIARPDDPDIREACDQLKAANALIANR